MSLPWPLGVINGILRKMSQTPFRETTFIERRNRFLVLVEVNGGLEGAHLPNSGRLEELLIPGRKALVRGYRWFCNDDFPCLQRDSSVISL